MNSLQPSAFNLAPSPTLQWQPVRSANFLAIAGRSYPVNTTSAAITVTLPLNPNPGDQITLTDYAGTWGTNNLTVSPNGNKIQGGTGNTVLVANRGSVQLVYLDSTQGWVAYSGFAVTPLSISVQYLLVGGGGGGSQQHGAGGGGGGVLASTTTLIKNAVYTITVGNPGAASAGGTSPSQGGDGGDTIMTGTGVSLTAGGGGGGGNGYNSASCNGRPGRATNGNGGGAGGGTASGTGGSGYGSGYTGGSSVTNGTAGAGGGGAGAGANGSNATGSGNGGATGGAGGIGFGSDILVSGTTAYYGGGGGGAGWGTTGANGGNGGGGKGGNPGQSGTAGTVNTGGGGGGGGDGSSGVPTGAAGGSGTAILRILTSLYSGTYTGTPTITTDGSYTVLRFNGNGTYTA